MPEVHEHRVSKRNARRELKLSRRRAETRCRDLSEGGRAQRRSRRSEVGRVGQIETFCPQLQRSPLPDREVLEERGVEVTVMRSVDAGPACGANGAEGLRCELRGIERARNGGVGNIR